MKRTIPALVAVAALTACTPGQLLRHAAAHLAGHGDQADAAAQVYLERKAIATAGRPCAEWYDHAMEAGFTPEEWEFPLSQTMYGESRCNPHADSPISTARGLMQHLRMWADDCGGTYESFYDPAFSLACAEYVEEIQGWGAWEAAPAGA